MAKKAAARVDRSAKLAELNEIVEALESESASLEDQRRQRLLVENVAEGLYEETDKLSKKAPAEQVTELLLEQVNQVIVETKELVTEDPYVQRLKQFVAAGDRPEHRDVVVILRMVLQGLKRFEEALGDKRKAAPQKLTEARVLQYATQKYVSDGTVVAKNELKEAYTRHAEGWFVGDDETFDFADLDETDLKEYFGVE